MIEVPQGGRRGPQPGRLAVELPGAVPGWVVRLVPAVLVLGLGTWAGGSWVGLLAALLLAVVAAWRPSGAVPAALALVLGTSVVVGGRDLLDGSAVLELAGLVLGLHLVAAGTALTRHVAWRGLVDPAALGRLLLDLAPVQLASQALVVVAWGAHGSASSLGWRAAGTLALAALVLLTMHGGAGRSDRSTAARR